MRQREVTQTILHTPKSHDMLDWSIRRKVQRCRWDSVDILDMFSWWTFKKNHKNYLLKADVATNKCLVERENRSARGTNAIAQKKRKDAVFYGLRNANSLCDDGQGFFGAKVVNLLIPSGNASKLRKFKGRIHREGYGYVVISDNAKRSTRRFETRDVVDIRWNDDLRMYTIQLGNGY